MPDSPSLSDRKTLLVRVAPEVAEWLEREGSEPVHVLAIERHDDGTADLILRTPGPDSEVERLRKTLAQIVGWGTYGYQDLNSGGVLAHVRKTAQRALDEGGGR